MPIRRTVPVDLACGSELLVRPTVLARLAASNSRAFLWRLRIEGLLNLHDVLAISLRLAFV